ncbi:sensor domain-containing diguanylate cyclase [Simplicispira psychrophila]|uniref:sensor domain-containing diguanylate cyclase n=1 Tax=Simplicispira psychrophila TaxID=80882 RepID=UPI000A04B28C|nr:PAS domain S-box protein [Simplicispira psychrophila]
MPQSLWPLTERAAARVSAPRRLARSPLFLLIGLQLLLALAVAMGVWAASAYLRRLALSDMLSHAQEQTRSFEDNLSQSFNLLHTHLRALTTERPDLFREPQQLRSALVALQQKLPYIRSLSVVDAQGTVVISTHAANLGHQPPLGPLLPQMAQGTPGVLRFGHPWRGRDFADGSPWPPERQAGPVTDAGFFPVTLVLPEAPQWRLVTTINSDYFINLALNHQVSVKLRHSLYADDGTLLFSSAKDAQPGVALAPQGPLVHILERQIGTAQWPPAQDQDAQLATFRVSRSHPWFVLSQASRQEVLRPWQQQTHSLALIAALTVAVLLLVTGALTWRVQRTLAREERYLEESRLAANMFSRSSDLIAITDGHKRVLTVNPAFEQGLGFSAQEVLGRRLGEWVDGRPAPANFAELWTAMDSHGTWQGEVQEQRKDGSTLTGWLAVNAIRDSQRQVVNYVGVLRDLSRLHEDEATIRKLSLAVEQSPVSIVITSTEPVIEYANPQFFRSTGYTPQEVLGRNPRVLQSGQTPKATYTAMWATLCAGQMWLGEFVNQRKDGSLYIESATVAPLLDAAGRTTHYMGIKQDITAQKAAENALRLMANVIAQTHDGVMVCDAQQHIIDVNPAFTRITGYTEAEVLGRKPSLLSAGSKNRGQYADMEAALHAHGHWQGEFWNRRSDGSLYAIASTLNTVCNDAGEVTHYINVFSDVTEHKHQNEHLKLLAHFDPLTHLPNRTLLADRLTQAMARVLPEQQQLAVCFMDLDGFKAVNDTHGHEAGDELLVIVARRLEANVRTNDTVARQGGDEFVLLLSGLPDPAEGERAAERLLRAVREPIVAHGHTVQVGASIGIALYPQDGDDPETLLRCADQAMYQAKQGGRNRWVFYTPGMAEVPSTLRNPAIESGKKELLSAL